MPGSFSGNGSVKWMVEVDDVKGTPKSESKGGKKYYQEGLDETLPGERFVITIKYPKNALEQAQFRQQLSAAATNTGSDVATLSIPIEDIQSGNNPPTDDQIKIDW
jgi:hypothetical protein